VVVAGSTPADRTKFTSFLRGFPLENVTHRSDQLSYSGFIRRYYADGEFE
jgi:hypothetical protein